MKKFDDEILMAYVDSELSEEERKEVELFLAEDPTARETVERYRITRTAIDQFADILEEPVPDHLINMIRQLEQQQDVVKLPGRKNAGRRWMAIAASLVIGVGFGSITMNYLVVQPSENEASIAANRMAELSHALEAMKAGKEAAEKNMAAAASQIDDMGKALEVALAEKEKIQEQVLAVKQKPLAKGVDSIFPFKLVSDAIDNGSKLSADMQESILSELNRESPPVTTASQYESLSDLQPAETEETKGSEQMEMSSVTPNMSFDQSTKVKAILGEFSYSGKTCRLFEYEIQPQADTSVFIACQSGSGIWEIVQSQ